MPTVLVVDDSAVDRRLVGGLLAADSNLQIRYAVDGAQALGAMEQSVPDLVVTDLVMPHVDGLELAGTVREKYHGLPVILITSQGSEEIAIKALRRGASSYVPKHRLGEDLLETVRSVLLVSARRRSQTRVMSRIAKIEYALELENDSTLVNPLVEYLQDGIMQMAVCDDSECTRIGVALREAVLNAMFHGNLEVSSELRERDIQEYYALAERRLNMPPYRDRRISVESTLTRDKVVFMVRDQGKGFDPSSLPDPTDVANLGKLSGRGLLLMRTFMDEVTYNEAGNAVMLTKHRNPDRN